MHEVLRLVEPAAVSALLEELEVQRLVLVSPHLDDAVFSTVGLLAAAGRLATVLTVFTHGDARRADEWTATAGFDNAEEEHAARRAEDKRAMDLLGCAFLHAGLRPGGLDLAGARAIVEDLALGDPSTLCVLPAAAGGSSAPSGFHALWRRLRRLPIGAPCHPDHRIVRDLFFDACWDLGARIGFYAEQPYIWSQGEAVLEANLADRFSISLRRIMIASSLYEKEAACLCYASQMPLVFGKKDWYRQRCLSREECIFLVEQPLPPGMST